MSKPDMFVQCPVWLSHPYLVFLTFRGVCVHCSGPIFHIPTSAGKIWSSSHGPTEIQTRYLPIEHVRPAQTEIHPGLETCTFWRSQLMSGQAHPPKPGRDVRSTMLSISHREFSGRPISQWPDVGGKLPRDKYCVSWGRAKSIPMRHKESSQGKKVYKGPSFTREVRSEFGSLDYSSIS